MKLSNAAIVLALFKGSHAACPLSKKDGTRRLQQQQSIYHAHPVHRALENGRTGDGGVPDGGYDAVKNDIINLLTVSQGSWPADFADTVGANYGPFMIRLAWHCSGSYRNTDGRGGCDGGRIRHDPVLSWPDNANLDQALKLLEPVKEKYGSSLSWGDLIILAGNAAIESMGGPILGFCGGRIDEASGGSDNIILGPSDEQEVLTPCLTDDMQGACTGNLGPTTVGLIYVEPSGHLGNPDPAGLIIDDIRSSFGKMGMNDTETLALAGGGHSFGKVHGACPDPPCGEGDMAGIGKNTVTSGFEGTWTTAPTSWTNQYFTNLIDYDWNLISGPGGHHQWAPAAKNGVDPVPDIMMLTSDVASIKDPEFLKISQEFAGDITKLEMAFKHAWYKLTAADMGPSTRCLGDNVPPAQPFQSPLPKSPDTLPDFIPIRQKIQDAITNEKSNREAFTALASKCASTFRGTDYRGGCNGAFVRFDDDDETKDTISTLTAIKDEYPDASYADIIVLAAQVALEDAGSDKMAFCGGRTDGTESGRALLEPIVYDSRLSESVKYKDSLHVQGLTFRQGVALAGMPSGSDDMDNTFFGDLLKAADEGEQGTYTDREWALVDDDELKEIVEVYAENSDEFMEEFSSAWTYLMTADRFDGPRINACSGVSTPTLVGMEDTPEAADTLATRDDTPEAADSAATVSFASVAICSILGAVGVLAIM